MCHIMFYYIAPYFVPYIKLKKIGVYIICCVNIAASVYSWVSLPNVVPKVIVFNLITVINLIYWSPRALRGSHKI